MENRNSENIEEHHIPDTLERQLEALMREEKLRIGQNKEKRKKQNGARLARENPPKRITTVTRWPPQKKKKRKQKEQKREESKLHRYKMTLQKKRDMGKCLR